ncbi:MAG: hypothetical protein CVT94_07975 [Bacteroidetes bacterium HGW-Bacteroidetes-11]|jgi:transcriptional regulator with XRE-family HTH domain|nr:MAG: hypothetical protein CVT94_07975 [Bacteroidetes bacterium HGW-Bacteroidetes-11]
MKDIFSKRLLSARKQAGLSQDQLVELIGGVVKKTSIARYERGEMMPETAVLEVLARELGMKPEDFFRPVLIELDVESINLSSPLGARREEKVRQLIRSFLERFLELEQLMGITHTYKHPFSYKPQLSADKVESAAIEFTLKWNYGNPFYRSVLQLLESNGVYIFLPEEDQGFDSLSVTVNHSNGLPVLLLNPGLDNLHMRKAALEEMARLLFSFPEGISQSEIHRLCTQFATAVLLPHESLVQELGLNRTRVSLTELEILRDKYGLPLQSVLQRAFHTLIISRYTYFKLMEELKEKETETEMQLKKAGQRIMDIPVRFMQLLQKALSEEMISPGKARELSRTGNYYSY